MTLYFNTTQPNQSKFTVNIANATDILPAGGLWTLSLRSQLTHTSQINDQGERQLGHDLAIEVVSSNERSTTFQISYNYAWVDMRDNFKNGIYICQIGWKTGTLDFVPYISGVAKVITKAGEDPTKDIVTYTSNNEDNSGFVYYSEKL